MVKAKNLKKGDVVIYNGCNPEDQGCEFIVMEGYEKDNRTAGGYIYLVKKGSIPFYTTPDQLWETN